MNKNGKSKVTYHFESEKRANQISFGLCSLMEHQSLVDIAICCGSNVLHAHKVVLAVRSPLFRTEFKLNPNIEQVVISGCEFTVIRSLIEFIYCGETFVNEVFVKYFIAAARVFQMSHFENLNDQFSDDSIVLPKLQFISKKPKKPFRCSSPPNDSTFKSTNYNAANLYKPLKVKQKLRMEAEHQACMKEALASRLAIANLKKEIGNASQPPTFIIEDTCTETTVENFIPNSDGQDFIDLNMNGQLVLPESQPFGPETATKSNVIQLTLQNGEKNWTANKIKTILENQAVSNVEIMFRTGDGSLVTVTDEMLQTFQKDGLQYQIIHEDGEIGEMQELRLLHKEQSKKIEKSTIEKLCNIEFLPTTKEIHLQADTDMERLQAVEAMLMKPEIDIPVEIKPTVLQKSFKASSFIQQSTKKEDEKFSPDIFFAESGETIELIHKKSL